MVERRNFLKAGALGSATLLGIPALSGPAASWKSITIDVECVSGTELAKFEAEGGQFSVEEDFGHDLVDRDGTSYTFDDGDEQFTIDLDPTRFEEGTEIKEFTFASDTDRIGFVVVKGGPDEQEFYVDPIDLEADGDGLHAPVNPNPPTTKYHGVSNVQFYECTELEVVVTGIDAEGSPGDVIDLSDDEVRFAVWHGPWRHSDQHVFDNGVEPSSGNGMIDADGNIRFTFPIDEVVIDDPDEVADSTNFVAELLVEQENGETWAGEVPFPIV